MIPLYEERKENLCLIHKYSKHVPPHLHHAMEMVYVTKGTLELGVGKQLFHMEKGDFAIVFPDVIHHYQVFSRENSRGIYIFACPSLSGPFQAEIRKYCPEDPVIQAKDLHTDVSNAIQALLKEKLQNKLIEQAYMQVIMARCMPYFSLVEKNSIGSDDIIYQTVAYVAEHFKEELSLERMAKDLGVSKYILSRVFSSTFHTNFNHYINEHRLNYASSLLECTDRSITDICLDAGFQSLRTFNRVFQEKYRMSPREYRKRIVA